MREQALDKDSEDASSSVSDQDDGEDYSDDSFDKEKVHKEDLKNRTPLELDDDVISKDSEYSSD